MTSGSYLRSKPNTKNPGRKSLCPDWRQTWDKGINGRAAFAPFPVTLKQLDNCMPSTSALFFFDFPILIGFIKHTAMVNCNVYHSAVGTHYTSGFTRRSMKQIHYKYIIIHIGS